MRDLLFWESENFKKYIQIYFQLSCGEFFKIAVPNPLDWYSYSDVGKWKCK